MKDKKTKNTKLREDWSENLILDLLLSVNQLVSLIRRIANDKSWDELEPNKELKSIVAELVRIAKGIDNVISSTKYKK